MQRRRRVEQVLQPRSRHEALGRCDVGAGTGGKRPGQGVGELAARVAGGARGGGLDAEPHRPVVPDDRRTGQREHRRDVHHRGSVHRRRAGSRAGVRVGCAQGDGGGGGRDELPQRHPLLLPRQALEGARDERERPDRGRVVTAAAPGVAGVRAVARTAARAGPAPVGAPVCHLLHPSAVTGVSPPVPDRRCLVAGAWWPRGADHPPWRSAAAAAVRRSGSTADQSPGRRADHHRPCRPSCRWAGPDSTHGRLPDG